MNSTDLTWLPAWRLRDLIASRAVSPIDVVDASLERLSAVEPKIHAFITVCADEARAAAREADAAIRRGDALGPLHGVPVSMKDEAWVGGVRCCAGSLLLEDFIPDRDGVAAARLKAAGAVIIGMTNVPEFMSFSRCANKFGPETVNPWDMAARRSPGASSGGAGASIAAGVTPLGVGSDGGGSIRIPSASNGVVGLFPTPGRIPDTGSFSYLMTGSLGPMARDVRDIALAMEALSGPDGQDPRPTPPPCDFLGALSAGTAGMRVAWSADFGHIDVDPAVAERAGAAARRLAEAGVTVESPPIVIEEPWPYYMVAAGGEPLFEGGPRFLNDPAFMARRREPANLARQMEWSQNAVRGGAPLTRDAYDAAMVKVERLRAQFNQLFERYDAVLTPMLPETAPALPDEGWGDPYTKGFCCGTYYASIANMLWLPALSYPAGLVDGLPVGLQIIGPYGREDKVLRLARALEQLAPFDVHPPHLAP
jgi:Asp-tRNA(Asn)/Glu-tRNA(Gln) amidotransferase A subunit family amidase